jgi:hypothetical protein
VGVAVPSGERAATAVFSDVRAAAILGLAAVARWAERPAATLLWRAGKHRYAPEPDERRRRTLGPVVTAGAWATIGFGSSDDGSWRSACDGGCQSHPHDDDSSEARPGVAPAGIPPSVTTSTFPRRERRRQTSLDDERWQIDDLVFILFCLHIYANVNRLLWYIVSSWLSFHLFYVYDIYIHILCKHLLIFV